MPFAPNQFADSGCFLDVEEEPDLDVFKQMGETPLEIPHLKHTACNAHFLPNRGVQFAVPKEPKLRAPQ